MDTITANICAGVLRAIAVKTPKVETPKPDRPRLYLVVNWREGLWRVCTPLEDPTRFVLQLGDDLVMIPGSAEQPTAWTEESVRAAALPFGDRWESATSRDDLLDKLVAFARDVLGVIGESK